MSTAKDPSAPATSSPAPMHIAARRQKRAGVLTLSLMGVTPLVLLAWDPMYRDVQVFQNLASCEQSTGLPTEKCKQLRDEAWRRTTQLAPSYASFSACEREFTRIDNNCKIGVWCAAQAVTNCSLGDDGLARPVPAAFLVSRGLVGQMRGSEPVDWTEVGADELQPVFGMTEETIYGSNSSAYTSNYYGAHYAYAGRNLLLFTSQGQYLGHQNNRQLSSQLNLHRSHLQASSYTQQFQGNQLPARFQGSASRGGFGATARSSMAMASG
ncbi:DUF1190 domain-containing protein [Ectopseudomonas khazarica]|uniref:DUF1190 domain-containing protein n=1 Tax=Ectopseudomonas khazarica TaxID=2502979 RepID=UPI00142F0921|nr:DUF1190 domain-containing protein [Pseudomonas khazarica]